MSFILNAPANSQSVQGALSSQYTNWVQDQIHNAANEIAYQWFNAEAGRSLDTALAIRDALEHGKFSVDDLFLAANGKSSLGSDLPGDPHPKLVVAGQVVDLTSFFSGTQVTEWSSGNAKNPQFHAREYFTNFDAGTAPEGWDHPTAPNHAPEANPIVVSFDEWQSEFTNHVRTNTGEVWEKIDLLKGATDADSDPLHIDGAVLFGNEVLVDGQPSASHPYIKLVGNELWVDVNSRDLDYLKADPLASDHSLSLNVTYKLTDGKSAAVDTSATITINGTEDMWKGEGKGSVSNEHSYRSNNKDDDGVLTVDKSKFPVDGFDFSNFTGTISASSSGLTGNQKVNITDSGDPDWKLDGRDAMSQVKDGNADSRVLDPHALDDGKVDYHFQFNQGDAGDKVTVTLDYHYDYWYMA